MATISMIEDLYRSNDWAHERLFALCEGLTDEQGDQPRELGLGSLRATLFHILAAEQIWYERWTGAPWRPFPTGPTGMPFTEIGAGLKQIARDRQDLIDRERGTNWKRMVNYRDLRGNEFSRPLNELLLHVANHGIHHRAQVLSYLKTFGRTVPVGLDYLFYRLAQPTVAQDEAAVTALRGRGIEIASAPGIDVDWDAEFIQRYFAYHDWANSRMLDLAQPLDDTNLDRDFGMGLGTIRKTLYHLHDVEPFWFNNWNGTGAAFVQTAPGTALAQLRQSWAEMASRRNGFISTLDAAGAARVISISFGGPPMKFRVVESLVQICMHGTHHRAQLINMLRHSGITAPAFDYVVWLKEARGI